jgi:hypothetical protein
MLCLPNSPVLTRIMASYVRLDASGTGVPALHEVGLLRVGPAIAGYFFLCATHHLLSAGPMRKFYEYWLTMRRGPMRWIEYSFSASTIVIIIASQAGVRDVGSLVSTFALVACMMWFGMMVRPTSARVRCSAACALLVLWGQSLTSVAESVFFYARRCTLALFLPADRAAAAAPAGRDCTPF